MEGNKSKSQQKLRIGASALAKRGVGPPFLPPKAEARSAANMSKSVNAAKSKGEPIVGPGACHASAVNPAGQHLPFSPNVRRMSASGRRKKKPRRLL
jgi:hypothetical protein